MSEMVSLDYLYVTNWSLWAGREAAAAHRPARARAPRAGERLHRASGRMADAGVLTMLLARVLTACDHTGRRAAGTWRRVHDE